MKIQEFKTWFLGLCYGLEGRCPNNETFETIIREVVILEEDEEQDPFTKNPENAGEGVLDSRGSISELESQLDRFIQGIVDNNPGMKVSKVNY